ncbi:unnamed protein product [Symbiodinium sp. KB8]|nr:unnamed protein product [Symbiodinium sp. KB8]
MRRKAEHLGVRGRERVLASHAIRCEEGADRRPARASQAQGPCLLIRQHAPEYPNHDMTEMVGPGNRLTFDIIVGRVGRAWELGRTHEPSEGSTGGSCREGPIHKSPLHDNGEGVTGNGTCAPGAQGPEMANAAGDEGSNTNLEGDDVVNRPRVRHGGETDTEVTLRRDSQNGEYD